MSENVTMVYVCQKETCEHFGRMGMAACSDRGHQEPMPFVSKECADALAAGVRSFLESVPYVAPEAMELHVRVKLAEPLTEYMEDIGDA